MFRDRPPLWWSLALALLFCAVALIAPRRLAPLNRIWLRFGLALSWIVNPVITAVLYYLAFVPTGLIIKLTRQDLLRLKGDAATSSYWVRREPPGPQPESMTKQF